MCEILHGNTEMHGVRLHTIYCAHETSTHRQMESRMCQCDTHTHGHSLTQSIFPIFFFIKHRFFSVLLALSLFNLAVHCYFALDVFFHSSLSIWCCVCACILTERWSIQCHDILMFCHRHAFSCSIASSSFLNIQCMCFFGVVGPQNWSNTLDDFAARRLPSGRFSLFFGAKCVKMFCMFIQSFAAF